MKIEYCEKWLNAKKQAHRVLDESQAKRRHEEFLPYCAIIGGKESPTHVVSIAGDWVSVKFLDEFLREYLNYDFKAVKPGSLFLSMATFNEYDPDTTELVNSKSFSFSQDGKITMEERNMRTNEIVEKELSTETDVNYEDYPAFGNYEGICVKERTG